MTGCIEEGPAAGRWTDEACSVRLLWC